MGGGAAGAQAPSACRVALLREKLGTLENQLKQASGNERDAIQEEIERIKATIFVEQAPLPIREAIPAKNCPLRERFIEFIEKMAILLHNLQHAGVVFSVAFSPDGSKVATGSGDGTAKIWNVSALQEMDRFFANLNLPQCELLQAIDMAMQQSGRVQATLNQWYIFTTFPQSVQRVLRLYIRQPAQGGDAAAAAAGD